MFNLTDEEFGAECRWMDEFLSNQVPPTYDCPECGWVTECYPNCPIKETN